jgi:hypothetical protein
LLTIAAQALKTTDLIDATCQFGDFLKLRISRSITIDQASLNAAGLLDPLRSAAR